MEENRSGDKNQHLEKKLDKAQKKNNLLSQRVKLLEEMLQDARQHQDDSRTRDNNSSDIMRELLARQRELNLMLNRSNTLLATVYEVNKMLSVECKDAIQALPAPKKAELDETMAKINDLFKKTGIPNAETSDVPAIEGDSDDFVDSTPLSVPDSEPKGLWSTSSEPYKPPMVDAEPVDDETAVQPDPYRTAAEASDEPVELTVEEYAEGDDYFEDEDQRRKWWQRFKFG